MNRRIWVAKRWFQCAYLQTTHTHANWYSPKESSIHLRGHTECNVHRAAIVQTVSSSRGVSSPDVVDCSVHEDEETALCLVWAAPKSDGKEAIVYAAPMISSCECLKS